MTSSARLAVGLGAAIVAGAWLGFLAEWIASSGGWDGEPMRLGAMAARGAAVFATAFGVCEAVRRVAGFGAFFAVPTTCLLGAALFGSIGYMAERWVDVNPARIVLFTLLGLPPMAGLFAAGYGVARLIAISGQVSGPPASRS